VVLKRLFSLRNPTAQIIYNSTNWKEGLLFPNPSCRCVMLSCRGWEYSKEEIAALGFGLMAALTMNKKNILLVDDDTQYLCLGQELLEYLGYQTLTASRADEALDIFRQQHRRIDLVIMDLNLPQVDGFQLLHQLKNIVPEVKVIIASGFIGREEMEKFWRAGVAGLIHKPFRAAQLQAVINNVLEE
jgi:two-component system, cell cycle sensor histidine kinase and response regulator CckA